MEDICYERIRYNGFKFDCMSDDCQYTEVHSTVVLDDERWVKFEWQVMSSSEIEEYKKKWGYEE